MIDTSVCVPACANCACLVLSMPVTYRLVPEIELLMYVGVGACTVEELMGAEERSAHDPLRQSQMKILIDVFEADIEFDLSHLPGLISVNRARIDRGHSPEPTAAVTRHRFAVVMSQTLHFLTEGLGLKMGAFYTLPDALHWLELDDHTAQILELQETMRAELRVWSA